MAEERRNGNEADKKKVSRQLVGEAYSKRVKIKIKERVSKKKYFRSTLPVKLLIFFLAAILGFYFGMKTITRYFCFWKNSGVKYRAPKDEVMPQLKAGQEFSATSIPELNAQRIKDSSP